ncbi:hypothetical protein Q5P01_002673 [Channa striata]|uniref:Uncharacterized protein n=1 Tax=Channa striata TaxID=64152 RepID=A0AA88NPM5_CHASR|nr:hypothetical protein Q5P01_002673 [Channa striata]
MVCVVDSSGGKTGRKRAWPAEKPEVGGDRQTHRNVQDSERSCDFFGESCPSTSLEVSKPTWITRLGACVVKKTGCHLPESGVIFNNPSLDWKT